MPPTLRQLSYLRALKEEKSFSRAALVCHVTQSTLSSGIRDLEDALGQKLVERGRKISLTAFGEETVQSARRIFEEVDSLTTRAAALKKPMSGPLRLGVIPTIAPYMLPRILPGLEKNFPDLEIQLHEDLSARLTERLRLGQIDLILMAFPYETDGLVQKILFEEPFMLACPANDSAYGKTVTVKDLNAEKLLLLEDGHCLRDHALDACKLKTPQERKTFSATSLPTLIQMVRHGYGITLLPAMVASAAPLPDNIKILPFANPVPTRKIGLAWKKGSAREKEFLRLAKTVQELQNS